MQVRRARSRLQQLVASHSVELAGKDLAVASPDSKVFLATFVTYKVHSLQEELAAKAVQYAHLQALMPNLSERSVKQAKIMKAISRIASVMDSKAVALQSWLSGNFVDALLLPDSLLGSRKAVCRRTSKASIEVCSHGSLAKLKWKGGLRLNCSQTCICGSVSIRGRRKR